MLEGLNLYDPHLSTAKSRNHLATTPNTNRHLTDELSA